MKTQQEKEKQSTSQKKADFSFFVAIDGLNSPRKSHDDKQQGQWKKRQIPRLSCKFQRQNTLLDIIFKDTSLSELFSEYLYIKYLIHTCNIYKLKYIHVIPHSCARLQEEQVKCAVGFKCLDSQHKLKTQRLSHLHARTDPRVLQVQSRRLHHASPRFVKLTPEDSVVVVSSPHSTEVSDCRMDWVRELRCDRIMCSEPFLEAKALLKRRSLLGRPFRHTLLHFLFSSPWTCGNKWEEQWSHHIFKRSEQNLNICSRGVVNLW